MSIAKELYNLLLEKAQQHFRDTGKTFAKYDMNKWITNLKTKNPEFDELYSQVLQNVADRVSKAYKNFFRRIKERRNGKKVKVGFPRFKKYVYSITYPQFGFSITDRKVNVSKIGNIPVKFDRDVEGEIKTFTIKQSHSGRYSVVFTSEREDKEFVQNAMPVAGMDVGISNYVVLSDGKTIENPRFYKKSIKRLRSLQKELSRKQKGSKNRKKARIRLARIYEKISDQRNDFLHKTSYKIVNSYSIIAHEKLDIRNMQRRHTLAQSISDASWGTLLQYVGYKAPSAGCRVIAVDPRNTSRKCSNCGNIEDIDLNIRVFSCTKCGLKIDRDLNASKNILITAGRAGIHASGDLPSISEQSEARQFDESGTIRSNNRLLLETPTFK